jgi:Na+-driven multidrug efflux pump
MPALFSAVAFSAFRAEMDAITPLLITLFSNVLNCVLDPILIFNLG